MYPVFSAGALVLAGLPAVADAAPVSSPISAAVTTSISSAESFSIEPADHDETLIGPVLPVEAQESSSSSLIANPDQDVSFGQRVGSMKWELIGAAAYITVNNINVVAGETQSFRFVNEGLFGRNTGQLGVDKLSHAWNGYLFTDVLYKRMARKVGGGPKAAWTAAALGMGLQTYGEFYDAIHRGSGFSWHDMGFNAAGVGLSVLRNTVPGLADKIDYRTFFVPPNRPDGVGKPDRFEKQRFLLALKGSGFGGVRNTPLRLLELQLGYRAKNFSGEDRAAGLVPERRIFVGVGFNLSEALLRGRRGGAASFGRNTLNYLQLPYTAVHTSITK